MGLIWVLIGVDWGFEYGVYGAREGPIKPTINIHVLLSTQSDTESRVLVDSEPMCWAYQLKNFGSSPSMPKSGHDRSDSLRSGLWVPCWVLWVWFGPAFGPNPVRNRRCPAGSLEVVGVLLAQPSLVP